MNTNDMIEVIKAHSEGKDIEFRDKGSAIWESITRPRWNFDAGDYRVKKVPRTRWIIEGTTVEQVGAMPILWAYATFEEAKSELDNVNQQPHYFSKDFVMYEVKEVI